MTWRDAVLATVLGTACVGCSRPGRPWCEECALDLQARIDPRQVATDPRVVACTAYAGVLPAAIVGFKDRGVHALREPLGAVLAVGVLAVLEDFGPAAVVPVPSAPAAVRRRGFDHMAQLAHHAAGLAGVECRRLLRAGRRRDQAGLGFAARRRNLAGTVRVRTRESGPVILVDDVRTSGATLAECDAVLRDGGYAPLAHVVITAAMPDPPCGTDRERVSVNCSTPGGTEGGLS